MVRLIAIGLCVVSCVVLSLLFVGLGAVLVVDLVRHPPQFVQREVIYVLVPIAPDPQTSSFERTGGIRLPNLPPIPTSQPPVIILTPVIQVPVELPLPPTPAPQPPPDRSMCDPSYPTLCISFGVGNIYNCDDIDAHNFPVYPPDEQGFDHDRDGIGCEKN